MIVDLFAGGGGASTGILHATGRHPDLAVNHDAIATVAGALRVPSDAMTEAGAKTIAALPSMAAGDDYWNANACWRAMLAASPLGQEDKQ
jgi:site-specific DNA-cytosine methylase